MAYAYEGVEYPSVTTITGILDKPALLGWASNCAVDFIKERLDDIKDPTDVHKGEDILEQARKAYAVKRDTAADAGTQCHHAIQMYIEGHDPYPSLQCDEALNGYKAFLAWEELNHVEWLERGYRLLGQLWLCRAFRRNRKRQWSSVPHRFQDLQGGMG